MQIELGEKIQTIWELGGGGLDDTQHRVGQRDYRFLLVVAFEIKALHHAGTYKTKGRLSLTPFLVRAKIHLSDVY